MVTIGTNYRSGSAIVATTGSGSESDSAMVAIQHEQQEEEPKVLTKPSVHHQTQEADEIVDSVNVTINELQGRPTEST
jgi:hypothetical protein